MSVPVEWSLEPFGNVVTVLVASRRHGLRSVTSARTRATDEKELRTAAHARSFQLLGELAYEFRVETVFRIFQPLDQQRLPTHGTEIG